MLKHMKVSLEKAVTQSRHWHEHTCSVLDTPNNRATRWCDVFQGPGQKYYQG